MVKMQEETIIMTDGYPKKIWLIWSDNGIPSEPVLWTEPCPFPIDDGDCIEYQRTDLKEELTAEDLAKRIADDSWALAHKLRDNGHTETVCQMAIDNAKKNDRLWKLLRTN
jgi:hypothetical protein